MLDIIIPTYKNKIGLITTLESIIPELHNHVLVIDDGSLMDYTDIKEQFPNITLQMNNINQGPGNVRQQGINSTGQPYIMFIDTGDYFVSAAIQNEILTSVTNNPEIDIFSWQHLKQEKPEPSIHNRLHGRVYKRKFLNKYNISFCSKSSYANEDIGFNRLCRLCLREENKEIYDIPKPAIVYAYDQNSITNVNNHEFNYKNQSIGLALNAIHVYEIAKENNITHRYILDDMNDVMYSLYYNYLCTKNERPEFIENALEGARMYYNEVFSKEENDWKSLNIMYAQFVRRIIRRRAQWKNSQPINFDKFINQLTT